MTAAELSRLAADLGLDVVGAAPAAPYDGDRAAHPRAQGARPLRRHALHDGAPGDVVPSGAARRGCADGRLGGALLLRARPEPGPTRGGSAVHVARRVLGAAAARWTSSAPARGRVPRARRLERPRRSRGARCEPASRSTARTRWRSRAGSAPGSCSARSSRRSRSSATPRARARLRLVPALHRRLSRRARSTSPGVLDATKCLSYWTQAPAPIPDEYRAELGDIGLRLRHLPGRLPVEPRDREAAAWGRGPRRTRRPTVSLRDWLERDGDELVARPRPPVRPAQRPPLAAAECAHRRGQRRVAAELVPAVERLSRTTTIRCCGTRRNGRSLGSPSGRRMTRGAATSGWPILVHEVRSPVAALARDRETSSRAGDSSLLRADRSSDLAIAACRGIERVVERRAGRVGPARGGRPRAPRRGRRRSGGARRGADVRAVSALGFRSARGRPAPAAAGARQPRLERAPARLGEPTKWSLGRARGRGSRPALGVGPGPRDSARRSRSGSSSRAFASTTGAPASGLGLAVARAIAEAHGGTLTVTSVPGEGATFTIALRAALG